MNFFIFFLFLRCFNLRLFFRFSLSFFRSRLNFLNWGSLLRFSLLSVLGFSLLDLLGFLFFLRLTFVVFQDWIGVSLIFYLFLCLLFFSLVQHLLGSDLIFGLSALLNHFCNVVLGSFFGLHFEFAVVY